jgi:hypothetical protein
VENNQFFAREYAKLATEVWILSLLDKPNRTRDDEMDLGNLCCALNAYEENDQKAR